MLDLELILIIFLTLNITLALTSLYIMRKVAQVSKEMNSAVINLITRIEWCEDRILKLHDELEGVIPSPILKLPH